MSDLAIRPGTVDDWPAIWRLLQQVFHMIPDDEHERAERATFEPDRSLVVTDPAYPGDVVAHAAAYTRDLTVPGGPVPAAHVTLVGVVPTHRRRRLLTRLMRRQLAEVAEPVAVLWATEGRIYPRFGYGMASQRVSFSVDAREVRLPEPDAPGRLRSVPLAQARPDLRRVYESVRPTQPGWSSRDDAWWSSVLSDPPAHRRGATELRAILHEGGHGGGDGVDGYALWRAKGNWSASGPEGEVHVEELVAATPQAHLGLWRFLLSIDLTRTAKLWRGGPGEPLLRLADEPRRLGAVWGDGLYVRVVDLPAALTARRYAAPMDVVIEVTDPLLPGNAGRWRLVGDRAGASCTPATGAEPADLSCDIADLGAAYLGGTSLADLAAAGRVRELRPGSLPAASTAFGWHRPPVGIEVF